MTVIQSLAGVAVAALVTPLIVRWLSDFGKAAHHQSGYSVAEYSFAIRLTVNLFGLLFLGIAVLACQFPGKTNPALVPWIVLLFAILGLFSLLTTAWMARATVYWNHCEVQGCDLLGRRHQIPWTDLSNITVSAIAQGYQLDACHRRTILVSEMMSGYSDFLSCLEKHAPPRLKFKARREY
jgi:hypothetical protein